jgi:hypothetical protein
MFEKQFKEQVWVPLYEALDYAVGITDEKGRLLAQGNKGDYFSRCYEPCCRRNIRTI